MDLSVIEGAEKQLRIILLGTPGSGKSRIGNTILGSNVHFKFGSRTASPNSSIVNIEGKQMIVVDTPSYYFDDGSKFRQDLKTAIEMTKPGPHIFLFCVKMDRFTDEAIKMIKMYESFLGESMYRYTVIVFTHIDQWESDMEEQGVRNPIFDEYLKYLPSEMQKLLNRCDNRYCIFNNRKTGDAMKKQRGILSSEIDRLINTNAKSPFYIMCSEHCPKGWAGWAWDWTFGWVLNILSSHLEIE